MGIGRWRNDKPVGKRLCGELGAGAFCWLSVGDSDKGSGRLAMYQHFQSIRPCHLLLSLGTLTIVRSLASAL